MVVVVVAVWLGGAKLTLVCGDRATDAVDVVVVEVFAVVGKMSGPRHKSSRVVAAAAVGEGALSTADNEAEEEVEEVE